MTPDIRLISYQKSDGGEFVVVMLRGETQLYQRVQDVSRADSIGHAARLEALEEAAKVAEQLATKRAAAERAQGFTPDTAEPIANAYWCEEIAEAIRALATVTPEVDST